MGLAAPGPFQDLRALVLGDHALKLHQQYVHWDLADVIAQAAPKPGGSGSPWSARHLRRSTAQPRPGPAWLRSAAVRDRIVSCSFGRVEETQGLDRCVAHQHGCFLTGPYAAGPARPGPERRVNEVREVCGAGWDSDGLRTPSNQHPLERQLSLAATEPLPASRRKQAVFSSQARPGYGLAASPTRNRQLPQEEP